ncbi:uncharacterized protein B0T15DRAFT_150781 [Chaetomium strumarium]|uniref:Aminoglycoside phosphotransferase domain-containing protein n=1 Tax=Chaetomium strumarium TaxID=1170767 RepID=A0AAJ0GV31_9PEZI|nr:hypothetical protein B0T15DRAFT_150781 [Chaetomium strumarium]
MMEPSLAINDSTARRFLSLAVIKVRRGFLICRAAIAMDRHILDRYPKYIRISKHLFLKTGRDVHLTEAATLRFVAEKTSIPVPRVHCAFAHDNRGIIVMERVPGVTLARAWKSLSAADRDAIFEQLRSMINELRSLPPGPGVGIESCVGGSLTDPRLERANPRFGPFKTTQEFHLWLHYDL